MKDSIKLTPGVLKAIIQEEREKIKNQAEKITEARKTKKINEIRKELRAFIQLKREQKLLIERIKKLKKESTAIKKKIKES
jgi:hypothetical protein